MKLPLSSPAGSLALLGRVPASRRLRDRQPSALLRPQGFLSWWAWGIEQADPCRRMGRGDDALGTDFAPQIERLPIARHKIPKGFRFAGQFGIEKKLRPNRIYDWARGVYRLARVGESQERMAPYLGDGDNRRAPMRVVLESLRIRTGRAPLSRQVHEFRILFALIEGHTDADTVRALIGGCNRVFFEAAATRVLGRVYEVAQEQLAPRPAA